MAKSAYIIDVDMGYGHQRTSYPLKDLAFEQKIISANSYEGIPGKDRKIWEKSKKSYEAISAMKRIPLIGNVIFKTYDRFQKILSYYPRRDLSKPTFNLKSVYALIKRGWGKDLISKLEKNPLLMINTFYISAFMAEAFNYPEDIFCIVCDADVARHWAPLNPSKSRIKYLAPSNWVEERLKLYGVKQENIFLTGYPLPKELIGNQKAQILKQDVGCRLLNLDPNKKFFSKYEVLVKKYIGTLPRKSGRPLTIMFSVGGAGAQKEIGIKLLKSLSKEIKTGTFKIILSAGIRKKVEKYFLKKITLLNFKKEFDNKNIEILFEENIDNYFEKFNQALRKTDILWTKPSELSFYSGLGIPIIMAPPIGSQEDFNQRWLLYLRAGILQENPKYANEWLSDLLKSGRLAEIAMNGFIKVEKMGTYNIEKLVNPL